MKDPAMTIQKYLPYNTYICVSFEKLRYFKHKHMIPQMYILHRIRVLKESPGIKHDTLILT